MQKRLLLSLAMALVGLMATAQNNLEVKDVSQPNDVYSSENNEAAVIVRCHASIPLTFSSTMDKKANPFRTDLQGSDSVYYIAFPTGNRYRGRVLTITSPGFNPVEYALDLQPKQIVSLELTDPNAMVDAGCYREHRNKGMAEFRNMNYKEALNHFVVARQCTDVDTKENESNIALVDSVITLREKGEQAYSLLDYLGAAYYYDAIQVLNPNDRFAEERYALCMKNHRQDCEVVFTQAEFYFNERIFDKAEGLYERVVNMDCNYKGMATERLNYIKRNTATKQDHSRVLSYEWRKDVPLGFSYGKYNMRKAGGFIALDINSTVFDAMRSECQYGDEKFPEFNLCFGWTLKVANPVWVFIGPGFTGKMYYGEYDKDKKGNKFYPNKKGLADDPISQLKEIMNETDEEIDAKYAGESRESEYQKRDDAFKHLNFASAISPVAGLCVKYKYFAFRLTYQYRFSLKSELDDFVGKSRLSFGVGVAF